MKRDKFWAAASKAVAVVAVALIVILVLAPGASAAAKYKVLYRFTGGVDGFQPGAGIIFDTAGDIYGTTSGGGGYGNAVVFKLTPNGDGTWTETVLYSFGSTGDGTTPMGRLVFDAAGNLYGTTWTGGAYGYGTVFQLTPNPDNTWTETVLYSFAGGTDGAGPSDSPGLIFDAQGSLYGTTDAGGGSGCGNGCGTVFRLTPNPDNSWSETVLHSFGSGQNGSLPRGLVFDGEGNLYGPAEFGGHHGCGTLFELTPNSNGRWTEKVVVQFNGKDGCNPVWVPTFDQSGRLYGVAARGGHMNCGWGGCGLVFRMTQGSRGKWKEQVIRHFKGGRDGVSPQGPVVFDVAGNLHGTTAIGGGGPCQWYGTGCGTVFELTPNQNGKWTEQVLHRFRGGAGGSHPVDALVFDATGNMYGAANGRADGDNGLIYEVIP